MQFRKLGADKIFNGSHWLKDGQVIITTGDGVIHDIVPQAEAGDGIEQFDGILTPGFINCHCHLELSHLKNVVPPNTGLVNFLLTVIKQRASSSEEIQKHILDAEKEMAANGIVAIADVCNTSHAIDVKRKSDLYFHNLIEVINLHDHNLEKQLQHFNHVLDQHKVLDAKKATSVLTPHAPYSVSKASFEAINRASANGIISIHNQETAAENEIFQNGQGAFLNFYQALGVHGLPIQVSNKTSFQTWLPYFNQGQTILIVHNSFLSEEDILFGKIHSERYGLDLVYCLCPNANLYIEQRLPPVELLLKHNCKIVLGTDSYASNWQLSIAAEIQTICTGFPQLELEEILQWATKNGAGALRQNSLGTIEKGQNPGLVLLEITPGNKNLITGESRRII
jgi:cytosine/adenosine deaminase-related metal-dependent hydrolase